MVMRHGADRAGRRRALRADLALGHVAVDASVAMVMRHGAVRARRHGALRAGLALGHVAMDASVAVVMHQGAVRARRRWAPRTGLALGHVAMDASVAVVMHQGAIAVAMPMPAHIAPPRGAQPAVEQQSPYPHNRQARNGAQHRVDLLRQHVAREEQRHEPQEEYAHRVGERHHQAQKRGVPGGAARTHQVGRHDGLSMAR